MRKYILNEQINKTPYLRNVSLIQDEIYNCKLQYPMRAKLTSQDNDLEDIISLKSQLESMRQSLKYVPLYNLEFYFKFKREYNDIRSKIIQKEEKTNPYYLKFNEFSCYDPIDKMMFNFEPKLNIDAKQDLSQNKLNFKNNKSNNPFVSQYRKIPPRNYNRNKINGYVKKEIKRKTDNVETVKNALKILSDAPKHKMRIDNKRIGQGFELESDSESVDSDFSFDIGIQKQNNPDTCLLSPIMIKTNKNKRDSCLLSPQFLATRLNTNQHKLSSKDDTDVMYNSILEKLDQLEFCNKLERSNFNKCATFIQEEEEIKNMSKPKFLKDIIESKKPKNKSNNKRRLNMRNILGL